MRNFSFLLAGFALLTPFVAFGQELAPLPAEAPEFFQKAFAPTPNNRPVSCKDKTTKQAREALEKIKVDLDLTGADPQQAFQILIKQIGSDYDIDPAFYPFGNGELDLPQRALNMKLTKASAARVLDSFCQALGIGWWAEKIDDSVMVHIVKLRDTVGQLDMLANLGINLPAIAAQAARGAELGMAMAGLDMGFLPNTQVKADATSPRDVKALIEDLCKQAGLIYAIDSTVPSISKTLAFENVPIKTALEALCATADLSMSVSKKGEKTIVTFSKAEKSEKLTKGRE
ncbi:hypothetical protein [Armatimonas sp.]|uniref:hypothetical protein n=1 Tax=Armatimonas sp. TaxID=1872638 RepID=UPI00286CF578|nr:hypothetical protein [Armatimonas sp.]